MKTLQNRFFFIKQNTYYLNIVTNGIIYLYKVIKNIKMHENLKYLKGLCSLINIPNL